MTVYKIDVEKKRGEEYWTNVYFVATPGEAEAWAAADAIAAKEKQIHRSDVQFLHTRTRQANQLAIPGVKRPVGGTGANIADANNTLPLFNVVRVDLVSADRSVSRKYYRTPVSKLEFQDGQFIVGHIAGLQTWATELITQNPICDPQGQDIVQAIVHPSVAMRQLRRGSKRKLPVLP